MVFHNLLLTTSKTLVLELNSSKAELCLPSCNLQWLNKQLWVKATQDNDRDTLPALKHREWVKECLQNSIVEKVHLDSELGETGIKLWADLCRESNKQVFLYIPSESEAIKQKKLIYPNFKKIIDWWVAGILLVLCSPLMLILAILIKISSPGEILVGHWRVGNEDELFKIYKFRTIFKDSQQSLSPQKNSSQITPIGKWLQKFNLDELPQLFNVLEGNMVLFDSSSNQTLSDVLHLGKVTPNSKLQNPSTPLTSSLRT